MQVEILNVEVANLGKYQEANISYKDRDGKSMGKKVVSFKYPDVFATLSKAKVGETYEVKPVKEGNFWNWTEATKAASVGAPSPVAGQATPRSTYETPVERAARQVYIVRQSSISSAIEYFRLLDNKKAKPADILGMARIFEDFVFNRVEATESTKKDPISAIKEMEDDIPL